MATNPYGRLLALMESAGGTKAEAIPKFQVGEMITGAQIKVGGRTLSRDDYVIIENQFTVAVDGDKKTFRVPYKKKQTYSFKTAKNDTAQQTITITVPALKAGDLVLCYQMSAEKYIVFGRVVE